jgi:hypothetical protein
MQRHTKVLVTASACAALLAVPLAGAALANEGGGKSKAPSAPPAVLISAPSLVTVSSPLPCLPGGGFTAGMTNTTDESIYTDMDLTVQAPLTLSQRIFSTYLPAAAPDQTVSTEIDVALPRTAEPGYYKATLSVAGQDSQDVWLEVGEVPERDADDNLALGEQSYASSTHSNVKLCGGVDGNTDSAQWGASGTHDATSGVFPDTYGVNLAAKSTIGRVELHTLDSAKYPAAVMGVSDFDIQVHTDAGWQTVKEVRGNEVGRITATFAPVQADKVQVVTYDSNDHKYSRIVELEAYAQ